MSCCLECGSVWSSRYGKNSRSPWLIDAVSAPGGQTRITQSSGPVIDRLHRRSRAETRLRRAAGVRIEPQPADRSQGARRRPPGVRNRPDRRGGKAPAVDEPHRAAPKVFGGAPRPARRGHKFVELRLQPSVLCKRRVTMTSWPDTARMGATCPRCRTSVPAAPVGFMEAVSHRDVAPDGSNARNWSSSQWQLSQPGLGVSGLSRIGTRERHTLFRQICRDTRD